MQCSPYSEGCDGGFGYLVFKQFAETDLGSNSSPHTTGHPARHHAM